MKKIYISVLFEIFKLLLFQNYVEPKDHVVGRQCIVSDFGQPYLILAPVKVKQNMLEAGFTGCARTGNEMMPVKMIPSYYSSMVSMAAFYWQSPSNPGRARI